MFNYGMKKKKNNQVGFLTLGNLTLLLGTGEREF